MTFIEAGDLLWQPQNIEKTQIYHFASYIKNRHGFDWHKEYEQLWQWSVDARICSGPPCGTGTG